MKRHTLLSTTAAALLAMPTLVVAESPEASTGTGSEVASEAAPTYDTNSPAISNGMAGFDPTTIGMEKELYDALLAAPGKEIQTATGEVVGMIENVDVNAQGNPELIVDIANQSEIPAEVLVVTVQPENVMMKEGALFLDTSVDELETKARYNSGRDSDDRVTVTLF